jgi:uncharacterized protein YaaQ
MTFTFPRLSAGNYEIQKNSETVGFIRKSNATKWVVMDVFDTPQHITKTLKEAKSAAENLIIFDTEERVVEEPQEVINKELNEKMEGSLTFVKVGNPYAVPTLGTIIF